ncbi:hypothetical protein, partial [Mesorhizobium sp. M7A.F.Ca.CA.001.06.1.1]|uniref:hypothetical protein n=1 Tax=Mesorhizobium sp. M7A.F.Ca.CA.001.06.1.1 TaxID=2496682 RepID=UPI0019D2B4DE
VLEVAIQPTLERGTVVDQIAASRHSAVFGSLRASGLAGHRGNSPTTMLAGFPCRERDQPN